MTRDHYLVLGISRSESDDGIHAAFRVQAKRYHPDIAGQQASPRFREVVEAYEILSDPERRRRYDAELVPQAAQVEPSSIALQSYARRPEPLIPETLSIARDFELRPSRSELLERVRRNFFGSAPKGERLEPLNVVVLLPPEKALTGGVVTVGVPVYHRCPFCRGTGRDLFADCCRCDGSGELSFDEPVEVAFPPFGGTRAVFDVPLQHLGIRNFFLRLQLQVTG